MPIIMVLSKLGLIHTDDGSANVYHTYGSFLSYNFSSDPLTGSSTMFDLTRICLPIENMVSNRERSIRRH